MIIKLAKTSIFRICLSIIFCVFHKKPNECSNSKTFLSFICRYRAKRKIISVKVDEYKLTLTKQNRIKGSINTSKLKMDLPIKR